MDGTVPSEQRRKSIEHFNAPNSPDFCFILSTRAGGLGINLETADTVIIFDSDWNPQADLQAMARAHRIGQQNHVNVYRLVTKDTVEEEVLERARKKMILEHAIISQVDTSGLNIGGKKHKSQTAKENYSKEELADILKYGASNIFKNETSQAQLEEMDLDDVLNKAENYETDAAPGGTSLGGDEFLRIAVQDIKADITSWDDIIPVADRELAILEKARADAAADAERRASKLQARAATNVRTSFESDEEEDDEEEDAKDRKKGGPPAGKTKAQRAIELNEKDIRLLVRGIQRFGDIRFRYEKVVQDAKLEKKNRTVVLQHAEEITKACKAALAAHEEELKARATNGEEVNKKVQKAIIVTHHGASSINAETTLSRSRNLKILNDGESDVPSVHRPQFNLTPVIAVMSAQGDLANWRLPVDHLKSTQNWSVPWNDRDDSALLVGIWKHGFGCWEEIQADESLGLKGKFFLENDKKDNKDAGTPTVEGDSKDTPQASRGRGKKQSAPGPVHLVRRGDYLLLTLIDSEAAAKFRKEGPTQREKQPGKSAENGLSRPKKPKVPSAAGLAKSAKASPAPSSKDQHERKEKQSVNKAPRPAKSAPIKSEEASSSDDSSSDESDSSVIDTNACKEMLRPVKRELKELKNCDKLPREEKVKVLSRCLKLIGDRIGQAVKEVPREKRERQEKHLWRLASGFWPTDGVQWRQIKAMCMSGFSLSAQGDR